MKIFHEIKAQIKNDEPNLWKKDLIIKKKSVLTNKSQVETKLYFVNEGSLRLFYVDDKGDDHTIRFGYSNSFISSLDSFLTGKPSLLIIEAIKSCRLEYITNLNWFTYINNNNLTLKWSQALAEIVAQQIEREIDLFTVSPIVRYERLLKRNPNIFQEIPHKYIASYLRMTPETFSRLLKS